MTDIFPSTLLRSPPPSLRVFLCRSVSLSLSLSFSLHLPNDMWVAVYFCPHLYTQDSTTCRQSFFARKRREEVYFNTRNGTSSAVSCQGESCQWEQGRGGIKKIGNRSFAESPFFLQDSLSFLKRDVRYVREHSKFPFKALK